MTHPADFRSLCAELVKAWDSDEKYAEDHDALVALIEQTRAALSAPYLDPSEERRLGYLQALADVGRTALSAPQQGAPSDEEIDAFWWKCMEAPDVYTGLGKSGFRIAARELLTRYGAQAVPMAVADAVAAERARWFKAVEWAMGTSEDGFQMPDEDIWGRYWWRRELAKRCRIRWDGAKWVDAEALPLPEAQP